MQAGTEQVVNMCFLGRRQWGLFWYTGQEMGGVGQKKESKRMTLKKFKLVV